MAELLKKFPAAKDPNVLVGLETSDDAGVFKLTSELALVQTIDIITPISDNPEVFGQVAAANSLSDVYAMGGRPITALNLCCFPGSGIPREALEAILRGGLEKMLEAGVQLIGGHTVKDDELKYGLSVTGLVHPQRVVTNSGARPGDKLILSKPIGSGVIIGGVRSGKLDPSALDRALQDMLQLNKTACESMLQFQVHACTDITGFGLAGHAAEVARASKTGIRIDTKRVPHYPESMDLIRQGVSTRMTPLNRDLVKDCVVVRPEVALEEENLCYDPQTSGGLFIAVAAQDADRLLETLHASGIAHAAMIGEVFASPEPRLELVHGLF
ncbi:MAG: selenide, water dikinase SelD [Acidobacteria bacterium]|nr:selenide, water dikinase SelD [Acidobacteriota bacterium]